jgi:hypothetical protein
MRTVLLLIVVALGLLSSACVVRVGDFWYDCDVKGSLVVCVPWSSPEKMGAAK